MIGVRFMDSGIDRIVEMIEQRFGKWAANGLLLIVGLGAAGFALHAIYLYLIIPFSDGISIGTQYVSGRPLIFTLEVIFKIAFGVVTGLVAWSIFRIFTKRWDKGARALLEEIRVNHAAT